MNRYGAIVIGAGHNGLVAGLGLARDGIRTLVVEQGDLVGGQAVADEDLCPGFVHHAHANALLYVDLAVSAKGPDLTALGVETIAPRAQHGIAFCDGRPPIVLYRSDLRALSVKSLRRYSYRDAKTFDLLKARADRLTAVLAATFYAPPDGSRFERQHSAIEAAFRDMGLAARLGSRTGQDVIDELFATPEIRTLMYRLCAEFGAPLCDAGGDAAFLGLVMWLVGRRRLPRGGMSRVPAALRTAFEDAGGEVRLGTAVKAIRASAGRADGVLLADGTELEAPLVISSIGVSSTYRDLLQAQALPKDVSAELERFDVTPSPAIGNLKLCMRSAPSYNGAAREPHIDECLQVFIGLDEPEEAIRDAAQIRQGLLPSPAGSIRVNTLWDRTQAPPGFHSAGVDCAFPDVRRLGAEAVAGVERHYARAFLDIWRRYAANMTEDNVLACRFALTAGYERKMLLRLGESQYRTHLEGIYLAGASTHPGGGVHGACAHNALQVIRKARP